MVDHGHIDKAFDAELEAIKHQLLAMGRIVEAHISDAMEALTNRDVGLARRVREEDHEVNSLELRIDQQCIRLLALRQPAATDLRFIAAVLKIVTDLERIGDLTVNMAERALMLSEQPPVPSALPRMAAASRAMLRDSLDAFVERNEKKALVVLDADDEVDGLLREVFAEVLTEMRTNPTTVDVGIALLFFAKHLERLADHTTNIAEMALFLVRGKDVRHAHSR